MIVEDRKSSTALPVKNEIVQFTVDDLHNLFNQFLLKIDPKLLRLYDYYLVKNNKTALSDFINNLEFSYKEKNLGSENLVILSKIFETIKVQLELLSEIKVNKVESSEILAIFCATTFSEFKKLFH